MTHYRFQTQMLVRFLGFSTTLFQIRDHLLRNLTSRLCMYVSLSHLGYCSSLLFGIPKYSLRPLQLWSVPSWCPNQVLAKESQQRFKLEGYHLLTLIAPYFVFCKAVKSLLIKITYSNCSRRKFNSVWDHCIHAGYDLAYGILWLIHVLGQPVMDVRPCSVAAATKRVEIYRSLFLTPSFASRDCERIYCSLNNEMNVQKKKESV